MTVWLLLSTRPLSASAMLWIMLSLLQVLSSCSFSTGIGRTRPTIQAHNRAYPTLQGHHWSTLQNAASPLEERTDDAEFDRLSRIHTVVKKLQQQIPTLLSTPLTEASAKAVYADEVKLVVDDIELASTRQELESLSTTLVLAVLATNQANSFFANAVARPGTPQQSTSKLESSMAMNPTSTAIRVEWKVTLPGNNGPSNQGSNKLQGVSELELDPSTGKVSTLRLLRVQFNEERLNARAIGESLSSLRQLVFAFQNSPFIPKASGWPSLSSLLGSDFLQQVSQQSSDESRKLEPTALYITESLQTAFAGYNQTSINSTATNVTMGTLTPVDDYVSTLQNASSLPLPGSQNWNQYVAARRVYQTFCETTLRVLSGNLSVASPEMLQLFAPQAVLKATDGSELLKGRDPVGNFFHTLASFRKRSSGTWELKSASLSSNYSSKHLTIAVDYRATSSLPGSSSAVPVVIEGTDVFLLEAPILENAGKEEWEESEEEDVEIVIKQVEQRKLEIKGGTGGRSPDTLWFMKSLAALDSGRLSSSMGADSVIMDLLQRVIAGENGRAVEEEKRKRRRGPPKLSTEVAARVYSIMAGLHEDVPLLLDKEMLRTYQLPPLHEYMSKEVELRGYLGETLARGLPAYNNAVGATLASLKGALVTGGAKLDHEPSVTVELTAEGCVRLCLAIDLKVLPLPSGAGDLINSISGSAISLPSGGFPLKLATVSDYVIDKESGDIYQHRVVETRINGQLTPGDVMSKWLQKQVRAGGSKTNDSAAGQRSLVDAISWVRSMSGRG